MLIPRTPDSDYDPRVSPYLRQPLRSLDEAMQAITRLRAHELRRGPVPDPQGSLAQMRADLREASHAD